ncbi:MAG: hypothetical protein QM606_07870 [Leucobacter sp.]
MIAVLLDVLHFAQVHAAQVVASSESDDSTGWLLFAGPAGGAALYWALFRYYRNTDKSHQFERETLIESQPVTGQDVKVDEVRGTKAKAIPGANMNNHRTRVQRVQ